MTLNRIYKSSSLITPRAAHHFDIFMILTLLQHINITPLNGISSEYALYVMFPRNRRVRA